MGYVYKLTNKINGKWYIGSTNGKNKKYFASGILINNARKKYGIENFEREILYEGADYRKIEEKILTSLDAANDSLSYNMKNESIGGSFPGEKNGMWGRKLSEEQRYLCGGAFRGKKRPEHSARMMGDKNPAYGKSDHTYGLKKRAEGNAGKTYEEIHGKEKAIALKNKLSKSHKGKKHNLKKVICPHCKKEGAGPNMTRYHFNKCKDYDSQDE